MFLQYMLKYSPYLHSLLCYCRRFLVGFYKVCLIITTTGLQNDVLQVYRQEIKLRVAYRKEKRGRVALQVIDLAVIIEMM